MAELGRARPFVVAAIGVLLTANLTVLSIDRADAARRDAQAVARTTTSLAAQPDGRLVFGKSDTLLGAPTVFSVNPDGSDLEPSSLPPLQSPRGSSAWSHDRSRRAVAGTDLWILRRDGGDPRKLTQNITITPVRQPIWSPDDDFVAFLWGSTIVVMGATGKPVTVAYRTPKGVTAREFISLIGWIDDNMAE
jgi:Tol biopolymer transport system component